MLGLSVLSARPADAQTFSFVGASGGDWNTAANWNLQGTVPPTHLVPTGGTVLLNGQTVDVTSATASLNTSQVNGGTIDLTGSGGSNLFFSGTDSLVNAGMDGGGAGFISAVELNDNASLLIGSTSSVYGDLIFENVDYASASANTSLINNGTINATAYTLYVATSNFTNNAIAEATEAGNTLEIASANATNAAGAQIKAITGGSLDFRGSLTNNGSVSMSSSGTASFYGTYTTGSTGTTTINSGTILFDGNVTGGSYDGLTLEGTGGTIQNASVSGGIGAAGLTLINSSLTGGNITLGQGYIGATLYLQGVNTLAGSSRWESAGSSAAGGSIINLTTETSLTIGAGSTISGPISFQEDNYTYRVSVVNNGTMKIDSTGEAPPTSNQAMEMDILSFTNNGVVQANGTNENVLFNSESGTNASGGVMSASNGSSLQFGGTFTNAAGGQINASSNAFLLLGGTGLSIDGETELSNGTFNNASGGLINVTGGASLGFEGDATNNGTINKSGNGGVSFLGQFTNNGDVTLSGNGDVSFDGKFTNNGAVNVSGNANVSFGIYTYSNGDNGDIGTTDISANSISFNGGVIGGVYSANTLSGSYASLEGVSLTGSIGGTDFSMHDSSLTGGTITFGESLNGGIMTLSGINTIANGTNLTAQTYGFDSSLLLTDKSSLTIGSDCTVSGDLSVASGSLSDTTTLVNNGTINATKPVGEPYTLYIATSRFVNTGVAEATGAGATLDIEADNTTNSGTVTISNGGGLKISGDFVNNGTIGSGSSSGGPAAAATHSGAFTNSSTGTASIDGTFTNNSLVNFTDGTSLTFSGAVENSAGATINQTGGGALTIAGGHFANDGVVSLGAGTKLALTGGMLTGTGLITGDVFNSGGIVEPGDAPGTLTIHGNYTQSGNGTLLIEIGGASAGSYSVLDVTGVATLDGTLEIGLYGNFIPAVGDEFDFLEDGSEAGAFSSILSMDSGYTYSFGSDGHGGQAITVMTVAAQGGAAAPEPGAWALAIAGLPAVIAAIRKRRKVIID